MMNAMPKAAVYTTFNSPLEVRDDIEADPPQADELKIRMAASGVCHSDLSIMNGTLPLPPPLILGHEGAGVVEEVGDGVTDFAPGDHVVISWVPQCGQCYFCQHDQPYLCDLAGMAVAGGMLDGSKRMKAGGTEIGVMSGSGTFSEVAVVPTISAVKVPQEVPLKVAALIGCGVLTGVGAALNTANIRKGDTVAVIGCGGVGLNVIQGARIAGAEEIIAVDLSDTKLQMAKEFGATTTLNAGDGDPVSAVMGMNGRGADVAFEVIGLEPTINQAIGMTRKGGETILVGVPPLNVNLSVPAMFGLIGPSKTIRGCWYGSSNVQRDVPKLVELYQSGELKLDELISREIDLHGVNDAFEAMKTGEVARSVIVYS
jgi:S-(hydroxymethyl)glutathione dehydrogenase / alcohol dehydrogenase